MDPQSSVPSPRHSDIGTPNNRPGGSPTEERKRPHSSLKRILRSLTWFHWEQPQSSHPRVSPPRAPTGFRIGWRRVLGLPRVHSRRAPRKPQKSKQQQMANSSLGPTESRTQNIYPVTRGQNYRGMPAAPPVIRSYSRSRRGLGPQPRTMPPKVNPGTKIIIAVMGVTGKL